jgi:membrane associated rhomboid family serine protease
MSSTSVSFGLPPFRAALRNLITFSTLFYIALVLLRAFAPAEAALIYSAGALNAEAILKYGQIWRLFSYGFLDSDPTNFLFTMLSIYFLGSAVQSRIGSRSFFELYIVSLAGSGLLACLLALIPGIGQGQAWGAGAASNAVLMLFFLLNRDAPIMLLFIPIPIPVKWIVIAVAAVEGAYLLLSHFGLHHLTLLSGLVVAYCWHKLRWAGGVRLAGIPNFGGDLRNKYYRWKRARAARKFKVYMKKHQGDPSTHFDDSEFHRPKDPDKKNGGPGGWVN